MCAPWCIRRLLTEGLRPHVCLGEEATNVMEVLVAVLESAAYQKSVGLPQAGRDPESRPRAYCNRLEAED